MREFFFASCATTRSMLVDIPSQGRYISETLDFNHCLFVYTLYLTIILRGRAGYRMMDNQRGA